MIGYATVWALLDPKEMRKQLLLFLSQNLKHGYAIDFMTLRQCGPWYTTVLNRLYLLTTNWKKLAKQGTYLADYGGINNNTETDPDYIHIVPAINAANVWMCRMMSGILQKKGMKEESGQLKKDANSIAQAVLKLYVYGKGYWYSENTNGEKNQYLYV